MSTAVPIEEAIRRRAQKAGANGAVVLDPRDPLATARRFIADRYSHADRHTLVAWRGELRTWTGTHYTEVEDAAVRAAAYEYLERAVRETKDGIEPFRPSATSVNNVIDALRAVAHLDSTIEAPAWLDGRAGPPAGEILACRNGLLHLPTRDIHPHSPALLCTHAVPYDYIENGPPPLGWLRFLAELWPDDPESIDTLQDIFGYLIGGDTRQQKMFLLVGPKRSGKGTIARVLRALLGTANVAGPTLSSLAQNFGLQSLIGRPLAIVSDARLSGRADQAVIVERLLSISGEDVLTVDRKHRDPWIGQLPTRVLILSNELPRLADTSGALASRFVTLTLTRSWYGQEDTELSDRLMGELPGILRWALNGWDRLQERGHFVQPESSREAMAELEDLASPVGAFVRDCCVIEPGAEIETSALYRRWRKWCEDRGRDHPGTEQVFGRDLRAAAPGVRTALRRSGADRWRVYTGIRAEIGA